MQRRFESKVILISGATSGIGEATARRFVEEGARIVCVGRNSDRGEALVKQIRAHSGEATFVHTNVKNRSEVELAVKTTVEKPQRRTIKVRTMIISRSVKPEERRIVFKTAGP